MPDKSAIKINCNPDVPIRAHIKMILKSYPVNNAHFLPNACVPNQKLIIEDKINISSSENTSAIA
jgi:hypothetical protein